MNWTAIAAQIGASSLQAALPLIVAGIAYVGHRLSQWLHAKANTETASHALDVLDDIVSTVVAKMEQTAVAEAKARAANGTLTVEDAKAIKDKALSALTSYYGPEGLAQLAKSLKLAQNSTVSLIADKIEAEVYHLKYPNQDGLPVFRQA